MLEPEVRARDAAHHLLEELANRSAVRHRRDGVFVLTVALTPREFEALACWSAELADLEPEEDCDGRCDDEFDADGEEDGDDDGDVL